MAQGKAMGKDTIERILAFAADGLTAQEIADRLGVTSTTIFKWIQRNKEQFQYVFETKHFVDQVRAMMEEGMTYAEVARKCHMQHSRIRSVCLRYDIEPKNEDTSYKRNKNSKQMVRHCLNCKREFLAEGRFNRLCQTCVIR